MSHILSNMPDNLDWRGDGKVQISVPNPDKSILGHPETKVINSSDANQVTIIVTSSVAQLLTISD